MIDLSFCKVNLHYRPLRMTFELIFYLFISALCFDD
ncbi:hypothetical protein EPYR_01039 [Erwinia pyrifoliae DSM 12163]|nr:hypothetical protein EPYR_01039 [Erwinia pyrifoliae DSM 12163]